MLAGFLFHLWMVSSELVHACRPTWLKTSYLALRQKFNQLNYRGHGGCLESKLKRIIGVLIQFSLWDSLQQRPETF